MKILFAVSNENVSRRIVENYQQKYQEAVSFKNVFYFNAIIREIRNDKTYDRIVISEDLEPFANSNYDVIDKFILERLKEISYETSALEKIPDIIVICTDRRTKSGFVLTKMHEYGIYNALVGTDRKIDAVCELLNQPRNLQEAKEYYKIEGSNADTSSVDDVTEQEVQNILIHYKRLGKNEDRYTDSFNNIAAQYTDKQLKIIIKCLPINVRAVLEAECPKYQELVTYADETEEERQAKSKLQEQRRMEQIENDRKLKQKIEKEKKEALKNAQKESQRQVNQQPQQQSQNIQPKLKSGIDLLDNKNSKRMTGNVIIPNSMNIKNERKIYSDEELQNINNRPREDRIGDINQPAAVQNIGIENQAQPQASQNLFEKPQVASNTPIEPSTLPEMEMPDETVNSLPELEAWDRDPFADTNNQVSNSQMNQASTLPEMEMPDKTANSLPGLDAWDTDPFADTNNQVAESQMNQASTLPGMEMPDETANSLPGLDAWDRDPFEDTNNQVAESQMNQASTLPGMEMPDETANSLPGLDAWDTDPFADTNNQVAESQMNQASTLPGMEMPDETANSLPELDAWDTDPFADTNNQIAQNQSEDSSTLPGIEMPDETVNSLPGLDDLDNEIFANTNSQVAQDQSEDSSTLPGIEMPDETVNSLPGLDDLDNEIFANTNSQVVQNQSENLSTLPGMEMPDETVNSLPGLDDLDNEIFANTNSQVVQNQSEDSSTLPGLEMPDETVNSLPGLDDLDNEIFANTNSQVVSNQVEPSTLLETEKTTDNPSPEVDNWDKDPFGDVPSKQEQNKEPQVPQLQIPDVANTPEVPQQPKRGRGRPRKYPIEPPKPKGKRGRPRKNPLPEETTKNQPEETSANIVPAQPAQAPMTVDTQPQEMTQYNTSQQVVTNQNYENQINYQNISSSQMQNSYTEQMQPNHYNQDTTTAQHTQVEQDNNIDNYSSTQNNDILSGLDDWSKDPFAENNTNEQVQPSQINSYIDNSFESQQISEIEMPQANSNILPGMDDDWARDPFAENDNTINNQDMLSSSVTNPYTTDDDYYTNDYNNPMNNSYDQNDYNNPMNNSYDQNDYNNPMNNSYDQNDYNNPMNNSYDQNNYNDQMNNSYDQNNYNNQVNNSYDQNDYNNPMNNSYDQNNYNNQMNNSYDQNNYNNQMNNSYDQNNYNNQMNNSYDQNNYNNQMNNSYDQNNYNNQMNNSYDQNNYNNQMNNSYDQNNYNNQINNSYNQFDNVSEPEVGFGITTNYDESVSSYTPSQEKREKLQKIEENRLYTTGSLNSILTKDKKIVAFIGASKSGTSFLVNNLACLFSSIGVKTAILDMTANKNSYFIYTNNDENLRNIAYTSIENLENGIAEGIKVDRNLNVYTTVPNDGKDYSNAEAILSTLVQNESLILIDCDFQTDLGYLANAQEIYLVQSMDILTIQPLTAYLRDLKTKGILEQEKLRVVINKETKVRGLSSKAVIGGMSFYNDPAMSYMTELFNKDKIRACSIPFDESVYSKYLESIVNCVITISGYNKNFMNSLKILGNMVYPLLSKQTYNPKGTAESNYGNNFSTEMNNTLNQMKKKY